MASQFAKLEEGILLGEGGTDLHIISRKKLLQAERENRGKELAPLHDS